MASDSTRSRIYWMITVGAFLGAVSWIFFENESFYREFTALAPPPSLTPSSFRPVRLTLDFGDGRKRAFEGPVEEGMTIAQILRLAESAGQFQARFNERGEVIDIAGVSRSRLKRWQTYRNGERLQNLPGHIEIRPGDRVVFRYE